MESRENKDISKELNLEKYKEDARLLEKVKEKMLEIGLFDKDFISGLSFTFIDAFEKDGEYQEVEYCLAKDGSIVSYDNEDFDRTKEVGIATLSLLGKIDQFFDIHNDKNKSQDIWVGNLDKSVFSFF